MMRKLYCSKLALSRNSNMDLKGSLWPKVRDRNDSQSCPPVPATNQPATAFVGMREMAFPAKSGHRIGALAEEMASVTLTFC